MKPILKYLFLSLTIVLFQFNLIGQDKTIDSLKLALKNAKHDTISCNILSILSETASDEEWPAFNEQLKVIAEKNSLIAGGGKSFYLKHLASAYNNCGYLAEEKGDISKALDYYHKSLAIREATNDKNGISESFSNIGFIYHNQGEITKALEYYQKSLKLAQEVGNKNLIAGTITNLSAIFKQLGNLPKALEYYEKGLKINEETGNKKGIGNSLNNIGVVYFRLEDHSKALEYHQKSLKIREELDDKVGIVTSLSNIANSMLQKGQSEQALLFALKGMKISKNLGFPENIRNSAGTLLDIYKKQNKYKDAFEMYELQITMRDSINNQETQKAAIKKQMQYTYEKKELETKAEQDKKDTIAKAELKQKENERNYFIAGFGLVALLALFILRGYKQKQKANAIILKQKHLVDEKQKEILDSIHYAKRIQMALLPNEKYINKKLKKLSEH